MTRFRELLPTSELPPVDEVEFEPGYYIDVDLGELIENIYIPPPSPDWLFELVKLVTERYGIDPELVICSDLDEAAVF